MEKKEGKQCERPGSVEGRRVRKGKKEKMKGEKKEGREEGGRGKKEMSGGGGRGAKGRERMEGKREGRQRTGSRINCEWRREE